MEFEVYDLVNGYRVANSLEPLNLDTTLTRVARVHSQNMAAGVSPIGHDGFAERSLAVREEMYLRAFGENIATNLGYSNPARTAFTNWMQSAGHKENIEGRYTLTGVGIARDKEGTYYFTQLFVLE